MQNYTRILVYLLSVYTSELTDNEVIAQAIIFLLAGYETTSAALSYFAYNMAVHPDCQEKLIQEIDDVLKGVCTPLFSLSRHSPI